MFEKKTHYKMYKSGKSWAFNMITTASVVLGLSAVGKVTTVHADATTAVNSSKETLQGAQSTHLSSKVSLSSAGNKQVSRPRSVAVTSATSAAKQASSSNKTATSTVHTSSKPAQASSSSVVKSQPANTVNLENTTDSNVRMVSGQLQYFQNGQPVKNAFINDNGQTYYYDGNGNRVYGSALVWNH